MAKVVLKLEDDISTDVIYPGRFMATVLPNETPEHAFADHAVFNSQLLGGEIPAGSAIVAGENFGCGSSREQAASALKGHELVVVARSFARIFRQNAVHLGLQIITCPAMEAFQGDELELETDVVVNLTSGKKFAVRSLDSASQVILNQGGLIHYVRNRLLDQRAGNKDHD